MQTHAAAAWLSCLRDMPASWRIAGSGALLVLLGLAVTAGNPLIVAALAAAAAVLALAAYRPRWLLWATVLALIVSPTYIRTPMLPGPQMLPLSLALTALLAALLALASLLGRAGPSCGPEGRRLSMVFIAFAAVALASLLDARTVAQSVQMWIKVFVVPSMTCLVILHLLRGTDDLDRLFKVLVTGCLIAVFYAIGEFVSGTNILHENFLRQGEESDWYLQGEDFARVGSIHRVYSFFTNPIEFGALMSMVYPYALLRLLHAGSPRTRIGWAAAAALMVFGVALSFSRGPMLAVILCTLLLAVIVKPLRKYVAYGCVLAAIAIAMAWPWLGDKLEERTLDKENVTLRFKLWDIAADMALDHPVLGVGFANFPQYQVDTIRKHRINTVVEPNAERIITAENLYLQLAAETGVIGLAGFIGVFVLFFTLTVRLYRRYPPGAGRSLILAIAAGATAYLINGLTAACYLAYVVTVTMGVFFAALIILDRDAPAPAR